MPYIPYTDEQKQLANSVDLPTFLRMRGEKLVPVGREYKLVDFHDSLGHLLCLFLQRLYILKFEGICGIIYDVGQTDKSEFGGGVNEYSK